ncbi:transmembrane protein 167 precursor, putative [Ichthyophthirius multifiliis]|uniref:Protein kish n=1 Tax=Ichthyophthirius multifiliis TaxID=5932 RepID=G0QSU0_ICHMU|nr:transmembrane protein 167 precursor, putative [Ichthyophthirius multifiliis]EGR31707.1 transmembrane protein 167 precursor, putative [Ichthyophthirius multifiliis]|eukprot:XP_004035193.1 transmembrane protein 167 precursor, putative [Ichthyophthirius multifiliis]
MSAFFNLQSLITVLLFIICTCSYIRRSKPEYINPYTQGFRGFFRRAAVIGDRLSPWVTLMCIIMGFSCIFYR